MMRSGGKRFMARLRRKAPAKGSGGEQSPPEHAHSGSLTKRLDVLGQALVLAIHEVVLHALGIAAGLGGEADSLGYLADMHRARPAADAEIMDAELVCLAREGPDL